MTDYMLPIITGTGLTTGDLLRWGGSAWVNYADSAYSLSSHLHDGDTLQLNGVNSNGGAFSFTTSGTVTFSQSIASSGLTTGSVLFAAASGVISQDNSNLFWDNTNKFLGIGVTPSVGLNIEGGGDISKIKLKDTDDDNGAAEFIWDKIRNTSAVQKDDSLGGYFARGYDGSSYRNAAGILFYVDDVPAANRVPGRVEFYTAPADSDSWEKRLTINSTGLATFAGSIISANYKATNKLTACATNAGALDFSAASKTLTVEDSAVVSQDYSSDASPTFAGLSLGTGELTCGSINRAAGTLTLEIGGTAELSLSSTAATFGGNLIIPDTGYIGSASVADSIQIEADGDVKFTQQIGIGVSPSAYVHAARSGGDCTIYYDTYSTDDGHTSTFRFRKSGSNSIGTEAATVNGEQLGGIFWQGCDSNNGFAYGARIKAIQGAAAGAAQVPTDLYFETYYDGGRNSNQLVLYHDGNVGINTNTPDTKLQVVGDCKFGDDNTNYISINTTGDQTFTGSAGFYPRVLNQATEPAAGTGATQCDTGELVMWTDTDDAKCYFCYNHSGTVKTVELT